MSTCTTIAMDGPDGTGKTTQINLLKEALEAKGHKVLLTKSSGGTPIGQALREVSLSNVDRPAETDLYISLAMGVALTNQLESARKKYDYIIIDRSPLSIIAYQNYGAQLKNQQLGLDACKKLLQDWHIDTLFVLQISDTELAKRNEIRKQTNSTETTNYFETQPEDYKQRVKTGYTEALSYAQSLNLRTNLIPISADKDERTIHASLINHLKDVL